MPAKWMTFQGALKIVQAARYGHGFPLPFYDPTLRRALEIIAGHRPAEDPPMRAEALTHRETWAEEIHRKHDDWRPQRRRS